MNNPKAIIEAIRPIVARCRTSDFWSKVSGAAPVHRTTPLRDEQLNRHANGIVGIGLCPIERGESTTRVGLLDLDSHKGETEWPEMVRAAQQLALAAMVLYGIEFTPFRSSGGSGIHLIALWAEPQDAYSVRCALRDVLEACGFKDGAGKGVAGGQVEVLPKQNNVPLDGWGSMFVLPGSGQSAALDRELFIPIDWHEVEYSDSEPVPYAEPPPVAEIATAEEFAGEDIARIRSALAAIDPNDLGYGGVSGQVGWLEILFAVHAATLGSPAGRALILEWSQRWSGFDPVASAAETDKQWQYARIKPGGIGPGTLFAEARRRGWVDPAAVEAAQDPSGFIATAPAPVGPADGPGIIVDTDGGLGSMAVALADPGTVGCRIWYDEFLDSIMVQWGTSEPRRIDDDDTTKLRIRIESIGFKRPSIEDTRALIRLVARQNRVDGAQEWVRGLPPWDGVPRVERFLPDYLRTADGPYQRAVSRYWWTALVGRIMDPGCKVDMVPVLVGKQGVGKSSVIAAVVPEREFFVEIRLDADDTDNARLMRGKMIVELGELRGLQTRAADSIKAWVVKQYEEWTPKFVEHAHRMPRRCLLVGTVNHHAILSDPTGNRRWLPFDVGDSIDVAAVERDRDQLWAEALVLWQRHGIEFAEAEELARDILDKYMEQDEWEQAIGQYMRGRVEPVQIRDIAVEVFGIDLRNLNLAVSRRIGKCLRAIGAVESRRRDPKTRTVVKVWSLPTPSIDDIL